MSSMSDKEASSGVVSVGKEASSVVVNVGKEASYFVVIVGKGGQFCCCKGRIRNTCVLLSGFVGPLYCTVETVRGGWNSRGI